MFGHSLSWILLVFTLLEVVVKTQLTVYESSHGFISNNHERYLVDDISSMHEELASEVRNSPINNLNLKYHLRFEPEFLDFKQRPLGIPHLEKVTLFNINNNRTIDMTSISGSTVHFHSSFFEDKKIPPLGNTTFNVVFLGREEGAIESNLFIQTTEGHIKYQVKGASVYSPYRLRPIVGIKLPLNASFSPLIYMHNPHPEPVQIVEVYGSGGDFLLELPSGELEGPRDMWEIQPLETKAVIRIRFHARSEQNHTAYVRIRLNNTEEMLVVPVEVEVTSSAGLFTPQGSVDFGVGGSLDTPKKFDLFLHNPLKKSIRIQSITTTSAAIQIEMESLRLSPENRNPKEELSTVHVATLTLNWRTAFEHKDFSGKIIVSYGKSTSEIPFYLTVVEGGIRYNTSSTRYYMNDKQSEVLIRNVVIKNDFLTPLKLINVSLSEDAQKYFHLTDFKAIVLKVKEIESIFTLRLKPKIAISNLKVNSYILLTTNITEFKFPLVSYNGKLKVYLPYKSKDNSLDLGLLGLESKKEAFILVVNMNPVNININNIKTSIPSAYVDVVGCNSGDYANVLLLDTYKNMTRCEILRTGHYAVLRLSVKTFKTQGQIWGDIAVITQYEQLSIPVHFKVAPGKLEIGPDRLVFDQCFPGKTCSHPLRVHSTFDEPMIIEDVFSIPPDRRLSSKHTGHIMGRSNKIIGHLYLNPHLTCFGECYTGMLYDTIIMWLRTLILPETTHEFDLNLVNMFYNRYLNSTVNGLVTWQNLTIRLDTSEVKGHVFKTRVKMSWPSLIVENAPENKSIYNFPLTQVGNRTFRNITIKNPSSHNLIVQIVIDTYYPNINLLFEGLPPSFVPRHAEKVKNVEHRFFLHGNYFPKWEFFKTKTGFKPHPNTLPIILKPNENFTVTVGYEAKDATTDSGFIFLRNNLTVLEIIRLSGKGANPHFKFGNRKPGSSQPLVFELTEKHLKDCERDKSKKYPPPNLSVKRYFTARNTGFITVYVNNFYINGLPCEGYGFKVLNCEPFILSPNGTKKIDIAFTPDFTLAKITRMLILDTSLNMQVNYTLVTTVPCYYLALCSSVLSRPSWEIYLYYTAICVMCFLLGFVVITPIMESERILKQTMGTITRQSPSIQPTLDLRLVGAQTRIEIRQKNDENDVKDIKKDLKVNDHKNGVKTALLEENKSKIEAEKYSALLPTISKSRRKVAKRNSYEPPSEIELKQKPVEAQKCSKHKNENKSDLKLEVETPTILKKSVPTANKETKTKSPVQIKKPNESINKSPTAAQFEEETSSTTTESSNTEDIENKYPKPKRNKKSMLKQEPAKYEEQNSVRVEGMKLVPKTYPKLKETKEPKEKDENSRTEKTNEYKYKNKKSNRKDKQSKKITAKNNDTSSTYAASNSPVMHSSPSISATNVWGENRAKFSDVVARSDNTTIIHNKNTPINKPTVYVEPYKQTNTELGPIGSRKIDYWTDINASNPPPPPPTSNQSLHPLSPREEQHNRFFYSEAARQMAMESSNAFLDLGSSGENWQQNGSNDLLELLHNNRMCNTQNNYTPQDPWNNTNTHSRAWLDWDRNVSYNSNNNDVPNHSVPQSGYLWGSSPVWQPWAPEVTRTPTRTPPGLGINRDVEDEEKRLQQTSTTYNPFGISNIWTQQTNPWNYSQGQ